jgi:hypothetical protein
VNGSVGGKEGVGVGELCAPISRVWLNRTHTSAGIWRYCTSHIGARYSLDVQSKLEGTVSCTGVAERIAVEK